MVDGKIVIDSKANAWAHELKTAKVLASKGHDVFFPAESTEEHMKSPDIIFLGIPWEIKAPRSPQIAKVLKVVREALHQAPNVIYDSQRVKSLSDAQIERELRRIAPMLPAMKNLIFVNRRKEAVVIKQSGRLDI